MEEKQNAAARFRRAQVHLAGAMSFPAKEQAATSGGRHPLRRIFARRIDHQHFVRRSADPFEALRQRARFIRHRNND